MTLYSYFCDSVLLVVLTLLMKGLFFLLKKKRISIRKKNKNKKINLEMEACIYNRYIPKYLIIN